MAAEIEVKLLVAPEQVDNLIGHTRLEAAAIAPPREKRLVSVYYDTPDELLRSRKQAIRIRAVEGGWVQTIKGDVEGEGGLSMREEVEHPVPTNALDLELLAGSAFDDLARDPDLADRLKPLFSTDFTRLIWDLSLEDGTRVEAAFDRGEVRAGEASEPIHELELELVRGSVESLKALSDTLRDDLGLVPGNLSKAKRGYALAAGSEQR